jgi:hypothetical protein
VTKQKAEPRVEEFVVGDGSVRIGRNTPPHYFAVVRVDGEEVYRSEASLPLEEAQAEAISRAAAVRRGRPVGSRVHVGGGPPPPAKLAPAEKRAQIEAQHGGGLLPRPKKPRPIPKPAPENHVAELPGYTEGLEREAFDVRRAERVHLERDGGVVPGGMLDPVAEVYRMAAHFYQGGYEMGEDEFEEIRSKGVRFVEADYRSSKNRWIFATRIESFEVLEVSNTGKGPRRILPYDGWVKEDGPVDEPPPKRRRRSTSKASR